MPAPCAKVSTSGIKSSASVHESTHSGPSRSDPCVNPSSETCRPAIIFLVMVVLLCFETHHQLIGSFEHLVRLPNPPRSAAAQDERCRNVSRASRFQSERRH